MRSASVICRLMILALLLSSAAGLQPVSAASPDAKMPCATLHAGPDNIDPPDTDDCLWRCLESATAADEVWAGSQSRRVTPEDPGDEQPALFVNGVTPVQAQRAPRWRVPSPLLAATETPVQRKDRLLN